MDQMKEIQLLKSNAQQRNLFNQQLYKDNHINDQLETIYETHFIQNTIAIDFSAIQKLQFIEY